MPYPSWIIGGLILFDLVMFMRFVLLEYAKSRDTDKRVQKARTRLAEERCLLYE